MLRDSDNTTAELLLKEIGLARAANGSTAAGAAAMTSFLNEKALADPGLSIIDGSGLDAGNKVSCALLARILAVSGEISPVGSSLPVAAQNGTLADRFLGSPAAGRVRAKTGTLAEASSLSGWVDTVPGGNLVFAIITNTRNADDFKLLEEQFAAALLGYPDGPTPASVSPKPPILAAPR